MSRYLGDSSGIWERSDNIYAEDIAKIKDGVDHLWQPLIFLQSKIAKLKH